MTDPIIVDAHEDIAWNILTFERDYTRSAAETRKIEQDTIAPRVNGDTLLGWPDYQRGKVAVVFSTLFAAPERRRLGEWDSQCYDSDEKAHMRYRAQLDAYDRLVEEHPDMFRKIEKQTDLATILAHWRREDTEEHPVGLVILMEGAEGVRRPAELENWYLRGVRIIGPAWVGTRYCGGTREPGGLTRDGYALLKRMAELKLTLDLSHMDRMAALQALDSYPGAIIASHANALTLLKDSSSNRHLSDEVIRGLIKRGGVIGIIPINNFLQSGWQEAGGRSAVTLEDYVAHIDYICQLAGDALHVGIGSDFDGGFGLQSVPADIDTIADLRRVISILEQKGYTENDITAIMGKNWLVYLQNTIPEEP